MSEINLSSAVRSSLSSLQTTADLLTTTQERLATGNSVNSALDDATAFFTAAGLNARASDLSTLLDDQGQAIQVVEAADAGITAISDLVESARAVANQALQTDDADARSQFAAQFDDILGQIETLAGDASFNGINLLDSENSQDLSVIFNEDNTASLTVEGVNFTDASAALGLNRVSSINNAGGAGAAVAASTQTAAADFNTTDTFSVTVGNSNGTDTTFTVNFEDTDATATQNAQAAIDISEFNTTDNFDIGTATGVTFTDDDIADGTLNVAIGGGGDLDVSTIANTDTLSIAVGSETVDLTFGGTIADVDALVTAINTEAGTDLSTETLVASNDGGNLLLTSSTGEVTSFTFTDVAGGGADDVTVAGNGDFNAGDGLQADEIIAQINAAGGGVTASPVTGDDNTVLLSSDTADFTVENTSTPATIADTADTTDPLTQEFAAASGAGLSAAEITAQINAAASAAGVNTSSGSFTVGSATTGIPPVEVITFASDTGDVSLAGTGGSSISANSADSAVATNTAFTAGNGGGSDFTDTDAINQTLNAIDDALTTLRSTASTLGSDLSTIQIRSDFTENLINTLEVGAGNLTLADLNEEGANLLTLQTRQTLASTSLSFATQADQSVLSLF